MKKTVLLIIPLLIILSPLFAQKKADEPNPMKGVKTRTQSTYEIKKKYLLNGEKTFEILTKKVIDKYDSKGKLIESSEYDSDGSLDWKSIYKNNSNGNSIEQRNYDSDGLYSSKHIYKYDSYGNRVEDSMYNPDVFINKKIYKYDSKGNLVESSEYGFDRLLIYKYIYKYDSYGNQVEESAYRLDGSLFVKKIYKYDSKGNLVESSNYNRDGSLIVKRKYTCKYDSDGNMVEKGVVSSTTGSWIAFYKYDTKNRFIREISYKIELKFGELQQIPTNKITYEYEEY